MPETLRKTAESSYVILRRENLYGRKIVPYVCMILRANTGHFDGTWSFPAGRIEEKVMPNGSSVVETALEAAVREAKEEVGVLIRPEALKHIASLTRLAEEGDHERTDHFFITDRWRNRARNAEADKCAAVEWYQVQHLPTPLAPMVERMLDIHPEALYK